MKQVRKQYLYQRWEWNKRKREESQFICTQETRAILIHCWTVKDEQWRQRRAQFSFILCYFHKLTILLLSFHCHSYSNKVLISLQFHYSKWNEILNWKNSRAEEKNRFAGESVKLSLLFFSKRNHRPIIEAIWVEKTFITRLSIQIHG